MIKNTTPYFFITILTILKGIFPELIKTQLFVWIDTQKNDFFIDRRRAPSAPESVRMTKENHSNNLRGQVYDSQKKKIDDFCLRCERDGRMLISSSFSEGARTQTS